MNVPKAAERATASVLRNYAELGPDVALRPWQNLRADDSWDEDKDRTFPQVDIRFSAPRHNDDQWTMESSGMILCGTMTDDDRDHQAVGNLYGAVQDVLDKMFFQFLTTAGTELNAFNAILTEDLGASFSFGGLSFGEVVTPFDDNGVNMIGINFILHFARTDY